MSALHQPPRTPDPQPVVIAGTNGQPGTSPTPDDETVMRTMQRDFLGHRIWREILPGRTRYIARRLQPGPGPHTVVTPDLNELAAALAPARQLPPLSRRQAGHD
jgi:hypothetical protein